jgi:RNA-directed DNA polymerase
MARTPYALDQCALYNVTTRRLLAESLKTEIGVIEGIAKLGQSNYQQFEKDDRWIETPKTKLKAVQRRIHKLLARVVPPKFMFSGFPGRSAVQNANAHLSGVEMVKIDITRFYQNSDGRRVFRFFQDTMKCAPDVAGILCDLTTIAGTTGAVQSHLPTGAVTSPILAYYSYMALFDELEGLATEYNLRMTVMVDDITFSGVGADYKLLSQARRIIRKYHLESRRKKERVWGKSRNKLVTGVVLTAPGPRIPNKQRSKIHALWGEVSSNVRPEERAQLYQRLIGHLFSAGQIEIRFRTQGEKAKRLWEQDKPAWAARMNVSAKKQ